MAIQLKDVLSWKSITISRYESILEGQKHGNFYTTAILHHLAVFTGSLLLFTRKSCYSSFSDERSTGKSCIIKNFSFQPDFPCNRGKCSSHLGIFPPKNAGFQAGTPGLPATRARIVFTFLFDILRRNFWFYLTALFYFSTKWKNFCLLHNRKYH